MNQEICGQLNSISHHCVLHPEKDLTMPWRSLAATSRTGGLAELSLLWPKPKHSLLYEICEKMHGSTQAKSHRYIIIKTPQKVTFLLI
jgi:hypothetical protein